jgi:hypothetical protein
METENPDKSQPTYSPLSDEEIKTAQDNTERCLDALDQRGEVGLQEELDRIYPPTSNQPSALHYTLSKAPLKAEDAGKAK